MFGREQRVFLRHYPEQGLSKTAVAERLRLSVEQQSLFGGASCL
jgi:hypothetical protein